MSYILIIQQYTLRYLYCRTDHLFKHVKQWITISFKIHQIESFLRNWPTVNLCSLDIPKVPTFEIHLSIMLS